MSQYFLSLGIILDEYAAELTPPWPWGTNDRRTPATVELNYRVLLLAENNQ